MASLDLPSAEVGAQAFADSRFGAPAVMRLRAAFEQSLHPMLLTDDQRRLVAGNRAACEMLRIARDDVCWLTMEVFTPPSERQRLKEQWEAFLTSGAAEGWYQLAVPDREAVPVEFSATANVLPSRHLMVFVSADGAESGPPDPIAREWEPVTVDRPLPTLSERERATMSMVASGLQTDEIAERLVVSPETVRSHVQNAMAKLGSHTRAHAVAVSLVTGQITWEQVRA